MSHDVHCHNYEIPQMPKWPAPIKMELGVGLGVRL